MKQFILLSMISVLLLGCESSGDGYVDELDSVWQEVEWFGTSFEFAELDEDIEISMAGVVPSYLDFATTLPETWAKDVVVSGCNANVVLVYQNDEGLWKGGKFDHAPYPPRRRDFKNIEKGYNGWIEPNTGNVAYILLIDYSGQFRTKSSLFIWE